MLKRTLALASFLLVSTLFAQSSFSPILLKNHKIVPQEKLAGGILFSENEGFGNRIYRIVQGGDLKLGQDQDGLRVLEYLPKNSFLVSINPSQIAAAENRLGENGAALKIQPEWKLSTRLFHSDIPDWAWVSDNEIKVWIGYYSDILYPNLQAVLIQSGFEILESRPAENRVAVTLNPEKIKALAAQGFVHYLQEMEDPGQPENWTARTNHRVNTLHGGHPDAPGYDGAGVTVGLGDDGEIGPHIDYQGRLTQNAAPSNGDHGDHVAGTIFGAGNLNPRTRGMAPGADIYYQSYPNNLNDADQNFTTQNVRITNSSYSNGCNAGYTAFTFQMDQDAQQNPELLHVFSAGNSGTSNCSYGAGSGWGNVTGGHKIAKNVIATANLTRVDNIATSSSRGPASDGRIKPDIGAVGTSVVSTTDPNSYTTKTGTSMSSPGVAGTLATLYQAYRDTNGGSDPAHAGLLKAILMNTAEDLGNPGPDFIYGYGRINARRAANTILNKTYFEDMISSGNKTFTIPMPSGGTVKEVRIMLYWPDVPGSVISQRALVNDLDMDVSQGSNTYDPWVLNPAPNATTLNNNAVRGRDSLNNAEQVTFANPGSGNITVTVSAFNTPSTSQPFFVVYEFIMDEIVLTYPLGGEGWRNGETEYIRWDAPDNTGNFTVEYSTNGGSTWSNISTNVNASRRYITWSVPNLTTDQAKIRVSRGSNSDQSPGEITFLGSPFNIQFPASCPDSLEIAWTGVPNATGYIVYRLGQKYMDSVAYTTGTSITIPQGNPNDENWYAVGGVLNTSRGRRSDAVMKPTGIFNCNLSDDLAATQLLSPLPGVSPACIGSGSTPVKVRLANLGVNDIFNFDLSYSFNGGTPITVTLSDTIAPGNGLVYEFPNSALSLSPNTTYSLQVFVSYGNDQNVYNDTLATDFRLISGTLQSVPYFEDFESFPLCGIQLDCGGTTCNLANGWVNLSNGQFDDIDLRTDEGGTASSGTGPTIDHNPGTSTGNYLYTESSSGCDSAVAILLSPCFDLDSTVFVNPEMEFWYHMRGNNIGRLHFDLITSQGFVEDVIAPKVGDQGNQWLKATIDLTPYVGQIVALRLRAKTGDGFRSDIAVDDFSIFSPGVAAPTADFTLNDTTGCAADTFVFDDQSIGNVASYQWDFGAAASPATASTAGPHSVSYLVGGPKTVTLDVNNAGGLSTKTFNFTVDDVPSANFSYGLAQNQVSFTDNSSFSPTQWQWDFGDGATSTQPSPSHIYSSTGKYAVSLTVTNLCGTSTTVDTVQITTIGLDDPALARIALFPNPNGGSFRVSFGQELQNVEISATDLSGKRMALNAKTARLGEMEINATRWAKGVYLVTLSSRQGARTFRVVKE